MDRSTRETVVPSSFDVILAIIFFKSNCKPVFLASAVVDFVAAFGFKVKSGDYAGEFFYVLAFD